MRISIVIRTKNEEDTLRKLLESFSQQSVKPHEVIVVDSGSSDATVEVARLAGCVVVHLPPEEFTYGHALNIGLMEVSGDVAFSISAHCLPANNEWIAQMAAPFCDERVVGVYGRQIPYDSVFPYEHRGLIEAYPEGDHSKVCHKVFFSNANSAMRMSAWRQHRFDEELPGCEDVVWSMKIRSLGMLIVYQPLGVVFHSHQETVVGAYRRAYREKRALLSSECVYVKQFGVCGASMRWFKSVVLDSFFLLRTSNSFWYTLTWLVLTPLYRAGIYYGQLKAFKDTSNR